MKEKIPLCMYATIILHLSMTVFLGYKIISIPFVKVKQESETSMWQHDGVITFNETPSHTRTNLTGTKWKVMQPVALKINLVVTIQRIGSSNKRANLMSCDRQCSSHMSLHKVAGRQWEEHWQPTWWAQRKDRETDKNLTHKKRFWLKSEKR